MVLMLCTVHCAPENVRSNAASETSQCPKKVIKAIRFVIDPGQFSSKVSLVKAVELQKTGNQYAAKDPFECLIFPCFLGKSF
jgi:hypothetical protein